MSLLVERLEAIRRSQFVGRVAERELFRSALSAAELQFHVLYLFGHGGVGKTTLLRAFRRIANQAKVPAVYLDGRNIDPSPDSFLMALQEALGLALQRHESAMHTPGEAPLVDLMEQHGRHVILIDAYEKLMPIDAWLRDDFLPQLSDDVFVVLAGRQPPAVEWRTDPGWQLFMRAVPLRNFSPPESKSYLHKRSIGADQHAAVLHFTHGHPLALALVADVCAQRPQAEFQPQTAPDVIAALVERFIQNVPSPMHRTALEACALVRLMTESLLAAMLDQPNAASLPGKIEALTTSPLDSDSTHQVFNWLYGLSFIESHRRGLAPHDLAREALAADLRWRNPDQYAELHRRARAYYLSHLQQSDQKTQRQILFDYIFLHRDNPMVRPYFEWQEGGKVYTDHFRPEDGPHLLAMVERHEGTASRQLAAYWIRRQPQGASVFRDASGQPNGFLISVSVHETTAADRRADPTIAVAWRYLEEQAPLRSGEIATHFRFWMAADTYQAVSATQSRAFLNMVQHYLTTPGLAFTFLPCADPEFWRPVFSYADLFRLEAVDYSIGDRRYGVYAHDWRTVSPTDWLTLLGEREIAAEAKVAPAVETLVVLSQSDFAAAVRQALRDFTDPDALKTNPLLQARLVVQVAGRQSDLDERVAVLRRLLQETAAGLEWSPRQVRFLRALNHTYFQPAASQEQAAELLDLPYGTYRRHLQAGLAYLTERLWTRELGGGG